MEALYALITPPQPRRPNRASTAPRIGIPTAQPIITRVIGLPVRIPTTLVKVSLSVVNKELAVNSKGI